MWVNGRIFSFPVNHALMSKSVIRLYPALSNHRDYKGRRQGQRIDNFFMIKIPMQALIEDLRKINKSFLFAYLCLAGMLIAYISSSTLITEELYINQFGEQLTYEQIRSLIDMQYKYQWFTYPVIPLIYLLKLFVITLILLAGTIFYNIRVGFKKLFQIVLIAEFIFLIPSFMKLVWFLFVKTDYELFDIQTFFPLSVINLINAVDIPQWLLYPLQQLNVFELLYWITLAYGLSVATGEKKRKMLGLVASSYGAGLFVWMLFITFISVNLT